jgi:hypothetical protein
VSPTDDPDAVIARAAAELVAAIDATLPGWTVRCVEQRMVEWSGSVPGEVRHLAETAGERARAVVGAELAELLALDIDQQRVPPLSILRRAVRFPTGVLEAAGVPHVVRDEFDERLEPDDVYGLAPASFAEVDPVLHEPGMAWGAAKAFVHLTRRRADGQR